MNLHKEYIKTEKPNEFIKITIHFNKNTYHLATSQPKKKGYCLTVTPVEKGDIFETSTAFSGFYEIIYPVERQSKKRLEEAIKLLKENKERYLDWFKKKNLKLKKMILKANKINFRKKGEQFIKTESTYSYIAVYKYKNGYQTEEFSGNYSKEKIEKIYNEFNATLKPGESKIIFKYLYKKELAIKLTKL